MIKPIYPVIDYFINYNYIKTELCENKDKPEMHCNGKCYLKKQLKKANTQSNNQTPETTVPTNFLKDYPISTLDFCSFLYKIELRDLNKSADFQYLKNYKFCFVHEIFHPPTLF